MIYVVVEHIIGSSIVAALILTGAYALFAGV